MTGLVAIRSVCVPRSLVSQANDHLRGAGQRGLEAFALWAGVRDGDVFQVHETLIPVQTGHHTLAGVYVQVEADELYRINMWLYHHQMTLVAQLHSHPGAAYHSETDDRFPIATTLGSLSIVVPEFAQRTFSLTDCAVYRLLPATGWTRLSTHAVIGLVTIDEEG